MTNTARRYVDGGSSGAALPHDMLSELEQAHARLYQCMADLDDVTRKSALDPLPFTGARFRISSASLARRNLFNSICAYLLDRISPGDAQRVRDLQKLDRELLNRSVAHVGRWPLEGAKADWPGYCRASREMRRPMRDILDQELRTLTPLLQRYGCGGRRSLIRSR